LLSGFSVAKLELLICGAREINVESTRENMVLGGFEKEDYLVRWLLEIFDRSRRAAFLYFISGTIKPPFDMFKTIKFKVSKIYEDDPRSLPLTHTYFYEIEIPAYKTKEKTRDRFLTAIFEGSEGFYIG